MKCTNTIVQQVPTKYHYKEVEGVCGQTGIYGDPVYCESCEKEHEKAGHPPHLCRHGKELYPEDGRDINCFACEMGE